MAATPTPKVVKQPKAPKPPREDGGDFWSDLWGKIVLRKWLFVAIVVHLVFGVVATIWIISSPQQPRKKFMAPGAGPDSAKQSAEHKVSLGRKQSTMSAPEQAKRVTTNSAFAKVALPEMPELPSATTDVFANRAIGMGGSGTSSGVTGTAGGGGSGSGSGINFFGLRTRAKSIVLLVDVSDSMVMDPSRGPVRPGMPARAPIKGIQTYAALEAEVWRVIRSLDASIAFNVVCFAGDVKPYKEGMMIPANDAQKEGAIRFIRQYSPALNAIADQRAKERAAAGFQPTAGATTDATKINHAGTRTMAALDYAFKMNPDAICLVSDGAPTDGGFGGAEILTKIQTIQKDMPRPIVINVVAYLADGGQKFMTDLAAQNQGSFKEIKPGMSSFGF
jgi:hypothetical protein